MPWRSREQGGVEQERARTSRTRRPRRRRRWWRPGPATGSAPGSTRARNQTKRGRHQHDQHQGQRRDALVVGLDHQRQDGHQSEQGGRVVLRPAEGGEPLGGGQEDHGRDDDHGRHASEVGARAARRCREAGPSPTATRMLRPAVPPLAVARLVAQPRRAVGLARAAADGRFGRGVGRRRRRAGRPGRAPGRGPTPGARDAAPPGPPGIGLEIGLHHQRLVVVRADSAGSKCQGWRSMSTWSLLSFTMRAHRREVVGEHGGLEQLLVGRPVGLLLPPARRGQAAGSSPLPRSRMAGTCPVGASFQCGMSGFSSTTGPVTSWTALPAGSAPMMRTRPER